MYNKIPKEDLEYILEPLKEDKEKDNKQIISDKIIAIVKDANGKIIDKREQKMRSLTERFLALMSIPIIGTYSGATGATATGILTNVLGLPSNENTDCCSAIIYDVSIWLGSGTRQFSITGGNVSSPIYDGTRPGYLSYQNVNIYYDNNSITLSQPVLNQSGNTVNVSEIATEIDIILTNANNIMLIQSPFANYDTFTAPISIPNGSSATFNIVINFSG
jgi:hypothetical protein